MLFGRSAPLRDPAVLRFRVATVKTGCWLTFAISGFMLVYIGQTWGAGYRGALVTLVVALLVTNVMLLTVVPVESLVAGRWRETFFTAWSIASVFALLLAGLLDPLPQSPLMLPLFMPLLFAGLSYPLRTAVAVSCLAVFGYLAVALLQDDPLVYSGFVLASLAWTAVMCLWQAHNRTTAESQRARLAAIVESSREAIISLDADGVIESWNAAAACLYGYSAQEAIGKHAPSLLSYDPRERAPLLATVIAGGEAVQIESHDVHKDGHRLDVSVTDSPIRDAEGRVVGIARIARDISDRERAERELAQMRGLLDRTQELSKIGGWEYELDTGRLTWTDEVYRIYGVQKTPNDASGIARFVGAYDSESKPLMQAAFERLVADGEPYDLELGLDRDGGEKIWVRTIGRPILEDGRAVRVGGNIIDITDRRLGEQRAERLHSMYRVLAATNEAIMRTEDPVRLLQACCQVIVDEGGLRVASAGLFEPRVGAVQLVASSGVAEGYLEAFGLHTHGDSESPAVLRLDLPEHAQLPGAIAFCTGAHAIYDDLAAETPDAPWRIHALNRGYRSAAAFPLTRSGVDIGAIAVYADTAGYFDAEQVRLLDELAEDISFGLTVLDRELGRANAERALRVSEERFRSGFEHSPIGMALTNLDGTFNRVNMALAEMLGYTPDELVGVSFASLIHPGDAADSVDAMRRILEQDKPYQSEKRYIHRDGWVIDVLLAVTVVRGSDDEPPTFFTQVLDVTDRKLAEAEHARLAAIIEASADAIISVSTTGVIETWNPGAEELYGYNAAEAIGQPAPMLLSPNPEARVKLLAQGATDVLRDMELTDCTKDGALVEVSVTSAPIRDSDGHTVGISLILRDVGDRKLLEAERERMEVELRISQKLEAVGQLAAGIAHEINTPVQFIGDSAHFVREASEDLWQLTDQYRKIIDQLDGPHAAERKERARAAEDAADLDYLRERVPSALARMLSGVERVTSIVKAMKTFGRVSDSEKQAPANLNDAIQTTLIVARNEYKYVAEVETILADLPPVVCNIGDLNQVFLNLIVNAAHAIEDGRGDAEQLGTITITTQALDGSALISVSDSGCGIPDQLRTRVFDPFFTTKEVGRGTGQGLSIARAIIERHTGSLTLASEVGKGTTFTIKIPIDGRAEAPAQPAPSSATDLEAA